jgi:superfamily II DNA or RNA helicase
MATGTGKTYTAFQILWRLWKAGRKKRILYLADRNVLIDQTMVNDFRPSGVLHQLHLWEHLRVVLILYDLAGRRAPQNVSGCLNWCCDWRGHGPTNILKETGGC